MIKSLTSFIRPNAQRRTTTARKSAYTPSKRVSTQRDTFTPSAEKSSKSDSSLTKTLTWSAVGAGLGLAAATLLFPAAGVAAALTTSVLSGVTGGAIANGALENANYTYEPYDPFNPDHTLHPDNPWNMMD